MYVSIIGEKGSPEESAFNAFIRVLPSIYRLDMIEDCIVGGEARNSHEFTFINKNDNIKHQDFDAVTDLEVSFLKRHIYNGTRFNRLQGL